MQEQEVFVNLFRVEPIKTSLIVYRLFRVEPRTFNRQVRFRLAADVAKKIGRDERLVFSVGDLIYSVEKLENLGPFVVDLEVAGTAVRFEVTLDRFEERDPQSEAATTRERLVNRLVDWYYREAYPNSFRQENANFKTDNIFAKLQNNLHKAYKININEGSVRATRSFGSSMYLLLDTEYRVTWEENLWESVKAFVQKDLNADVALPKESTIRAVNERYGRLGNKPGQKVQGRNKVGEYEIIEFDFTKTPETPNTANNMSQMEYFNGVYGGILEIKDKTQPLVKVKVVRGIYRDRPDAIYHVPELLEFDRIPPHLRSNIRLMSAISNITKPFPRSRFAHLLNFIEGDPFGRTKGFAANEFVRKFIVVDSEPVNAKAQVLDPIEVKMGDKHLKVSDESQFLDKISESHFHRVVNPTNLGLLLLARKKDQVLAFYEKLRQTSGKLGLVLPTEPKIAEVEEAGYTKFVQKLDDLKDCDIVISFGSVNEDLLYEAVKRQLLVGYGILSQHITYEKTIEKIETYELQQNDRMIELLLTMISMQLCAKLGGAPWAFVHPIFKQDCPILGLDVFHNEDGSITGACAVFDPFGEYLFSSITPANVPSRGAIASLNELLEGALAKYSALKGNPSKILIVRDGLSFMQEQAFLYGEGGELSILENALRKFGVTDYVFVMEKVGTDLRMFKRVTDVKVENPDAGTALIGKPFSQNEMLMVAQESYKGTVDPVLYRVVRPDDIDMIEVANTIYKLSRHHWVTARSIKIPAPAYHADEIQYLIRRVLRESPKSRNVLDRPFYL